MTDTDRKTQVKPDETLEKIQPSAPPRTWTLGKGDDKKEYTQKSLSFITRGRLFALLGSNLRQAMLTGGEGAIADMLGGGGIAERARTLSSEDSQSAESFVSLLSSVAIYAPDFLVDAYALLLAVPVSDRPVFEALLELNEDDGGFADESHREIWITFVRQNWRSITRFFRSDLPAVAKEVREIQQSGKEEDDS